MKPPFISATINFIKYNFKLFGHSRIRQANKKGIAVILSSNCRIEAIEYKSTFLV